MRQDKIIKCDQCQQNFVWTQEEQEFYQAKNLQPPTKCPICRATLGQAAKDNFRGKIEKISNF